MSWSHRNVDTGLGTNGDSHAKALQSQTSAVDDIELDCAGF
jgi:hypothetical protein